MPGPYEEKGPTKVNNEPTQIKKKIKIREKRPKKHKKGNRALFFWLHKYKKVSRTLILPWAGQIHCIYKRYIPVM